MFVIRLLILLAEIIFHIFMLELGRLKILESVRLANILVKNWDKNQFIFNI